MRTKLLQCKKLRCICLHYLYVCSSSLSIKKLIDEDEFGSATDECLVFKKNYIFILESIYIGFIFLIAYNFSEKLAIQNIKPDITKTFLAKVHFLKYCKGVSKNV